MKPYASEILSPRSARIVPWLVAVAFFMQMMDGTILNTALPGMARELGVPPLRMHAVVIAYLLTTALLIPASGWLAGRFGARRIFCTAIALFTLGSLLCALSPNLEFLIASRMLQGVGGALMVPVGRLIVLKAYPRTELVRVLSFVSIPGLLGPLIGPLAGGFLVQYASWHWIFLINLPVGLVGGLCALRYLPALRDKEAGRFDMIGFLLFGTSMALISFAMEGLGNLHLPKVETTALCILGLLLLCAYWLRCGRVEHPLFSMRLFATRRFTVGILGNLFARLGSGAIPFLMPLFLQLALGFSPLKAGLFMMPVALAGIAAKEMIAALVARFGFRRLLTRNTIGLGCLIAGFSLVGPETPPLALLGLLFLLGAVNSMQFTAMNSFTLIDLPEQEAGSGNSLLSVVMQLASSVGVAMAAALLDGFSGAYEALPSADRLVKVFHATFILVGCIGMSSAFIFRQAPPDEEGAGAAPDEAQRVQRTGIPRQ